LFGEPLEIVSGPFAVEVDCCRNAFEALCVQPLDAFCNRSDMRPRDGAEGGGPEFYKPRDVPFDVLETAGVVYGAARDILVVFRAVERKEYGEILPLAKVQKFVIEKRPVRVDYEIKPKVVTGAPLLDCACDQSLCKSDGVVDSIFAQERFSAEKRNNQVLLPEGKRALKTYANGLLDRRIVHNRMAVGLRFLVIAIGTAQVALFRKA
jgi:hypothetical protein